MLRALVRQAGTIALLRGLGIGLSVCVTVVIARLYGPEALGVYAYCVTVTALAGVLVSNGWSTLLLRRVSSTGTFDSTARAILRSGGMVALPVALLSGLAGFAAIMIADVEIALTLRPVAISVIPMLILVLFSDQISAMRMASIRGIDRPALAQMPEMLVRPLVLLAGIVSLFVAFGSENAGRDLTFLFAELVAAS
ncbi:MAG: oligosaccharide flippase family protein, partial [Alteraurantiacibacter sp. bin_em_oilr2.035]|nr:oligosaccharide flippase family protein [Alteraurantiacibacter sp. bin_em_oilr2.035]